MLNLIKRFFQSIKDDGLWKTIGFAARYFRSLLVRIIGTPLEALGLTLSVIDYYQPAIDRRAIKKREDIWGKRSGLIGIDMNGPAQLHFLHNIVTQYREETLFPRKPGGNRHDYYIDNGFFGLLDAEITYAFVRHFMPKKIIEVGSGFSTYVMAKACRLNGEKLGLETRLYSIDPYPNQTIAKGFPGFAGLRREKAENVEAAYFLTLKSSDILFIDSSHVVRTGGEVPYLFLEILPRLEKGVLIHIHDIFFPREYPKEWIMNLRRSWSEQYLLQAFLQYNDKFEVLWCSNWMLSYYLSELQTVFQRYPPDTLIGGSFWMRKKSS
jgi:predicted O-methyltransferase YrrM